MEDKTLREPAAEIEFDKHVERCLAMVLHHEVVQEIAEMARRVHRERLNATGLPGKDG